MVLASVVLVSMGWDLTVVFITSLNELIMLKIDLFTFVHFYILVSFSSRVLPNSVLIAVSF